MVDTNANLNKKRTLTYMHTTDFSAKLKSKTDFIVYLDKHRKYIIIRKLTLIQCSTTFRTKM